MLLARALRELLQGRYTAPWFVQLQDAVATLKRAYRYWRDHGVLLRGKQWFGNILEGMGKLGFRFDNRVFRHEQVAPAQWLHRATA